MKREGSRRGGGGSKGPCAQDKKSWSVSVGPSDSSSRVGQPRSHTDLWKPKNREGSLELCIENEREREEGWVCRLQSRRGFFSPATPLSCDHTEAGGLGNEFSEQTTHSWTMGGGQTWP